MFKSMLERISTWLSKQPALLRKKPFAVLSHHIKEAIKNYQYIDFYAIDAELQIKSKVVQLEELINRLKSVLKVMINESENFDNRKILMAELKGFVEGMEDKLRKALHFREILPEGMLDFKRILYLKQGATFSANKIKNKQINILINTTRKEMATFNKDYITLIKLGDEALNNYFRGLTRFYNVSIKEHRQSLLELNNLLLSSNDLTKEGHFALKCLKKAISQIPKSDEVTPQLGKDLCHLFTQNNTPFFYMPSSDSCYHIDYNPEDDFANTGGNCYGESIMFMNSLRQGTLNLFCPEATIINWQLDQSRTLGSKKTTLGQVEVAISKASKYKYIQWENVTNLFCSDDKFKAGNICGIHFSMSEATKLTRDFTPGHIAAVVKLDQTKSPYKYLIFEKTLGVFGISRDEELAVVFQAVSDQYEGMNYSIIKLVKYGNVTQKSYELLESIPPLQMKPTPGLTF